MARVLDKILGKGEGRGGALFGVQAVGSRPYASSRESNLYQQVLCRAVIERFAVACSKFKPEITGDARPSIVRAVQTRPNEFQTWPQFFYRCATMYMADTTNIIVPEMDGGVQTGFYPLPLAVADVVEYEGDYWVRWSTRDGDRRAVELSRCAIVNRFQRRSDWFGDGNILAGTLAMLKAQERAQLQAIGDSAQLRFIGAFNGNVREEDQEEKRDRFAKQNLGTGNKTSLMVYDNTFRDVKQLEAQNWTLPSEEMERIENNVFDYFGINRKILQNTYDENVWDAYYEGELEPWAIYMAEGLTHMTFSPDEVPENRITVTTNRLEYASAASKRNMIKDMVDRGIITPNEGREILQMPPLPGGDMLVLRGEYKVGQTIAEIAQVQKAQAEAEGKVVNEESDLDGRDADGERGDSEGYGEAGDTDNGDATATIQDRWEE